MIMGFNLIGDIDEEDDHDGRHSSLGGLRFRGRGLGEDRQVLRVDIIGSKQSG